MTTAIPLKVSTDPTIPLAVQTGSRMAVKASPAIQIVDGDHYQGAYAVTPSSEEQTLQTAGLVLDQDVTIAPIPQNYGLITWNGSTLTVS